MEQVGMDTEAEAPLSVCVGALRGLSVACHALCTRPMQRRRVAPCPLPHAAW